ncbi:hypothetical protein [Cohnella sp. GCM10027633]|uniref:hypothetical protein n=1 Tax=unclassified Cohnella TaxID=2636738 RepID=UPI0036360C31
MGAGIPPNDEQREMIKALLSLGKSKNQVAKEVGMSWATIDKVSKEVPDEIENLRERKRTTFVNKLWENIEDAIELGHSMIKEAKENKREIPLSHISTYVGTLYDKQALMTGGKTADIGVSIVDDIR